MQESFGVTIDVDHGGRWTSLVDPAGRQWLWDRPDPARDLVTPDDPFVDVGGLEECFHTIGGSPDHGALWTRPWQRLISAEAQIDSVAWESTRLGRHVTAGPEGIVVNYELNGPPGLRFIWAAHALLELAVGARFEAAPGRARAWPGHREPHETMWPEPLGIDYAELGPDDGSAMFVLLPDHRELTVRDGEDSLRFAIDAPGQPAAIGLWRNLGGYPWDGSPTYRNIGVEPMLGHVFDLAAAGPGDAAVIADSGVVQWSVRIDSGDRAAEM